MDTVISVSLNKIKDVKKFAELANCYSGDVLVSSGLYTVSGKSLLGLFSIDLSKTISVNFIGENPNEIIKEIQNVIQSSEGNDEK